MLDAESHSLHRPTAMSNEAAVGEICPITVGHFPPIRFERNTWGGNVTDETPSKNPRQLVS
jgi:hypothetical protein